ncbi:type IX secretion system membrane protein PorP/SprF [Flavobacterium sp. J49]|uniref:PorP/SprF family type IX secretion system membrane protein n=1 Tax=Flavobacterium sp. J49 TaxID=2718534 RepID=UPI001592D815|nr:type IX secretion system membrane protein PorP/SprF [Flavobacterium sp. J49]MBF6640245.1 type IX secretion system membrane protein PorP/SprF [Flavobacterium sp. J49]NIC01490.1 type IX secretion system membrane protein PorP/SprF [Flavobacterium sp. J49]
MKHKIIRYFSAILIVLTSSSMVAQQDPQFTHYMYNMSVINPAYATENKDVINMGGIYRAQWVGIEGAPTTQSFFAHKPLSRKVEMGISIVHDEIGDVVEESNIYADFAYVLSLSEKTRLSFGVKAGVTLFSTNFNGFQYTSPLLDPAFENNISQTFPNVGAGTYLFGDNYYLGFSTPNLLTTKHLENTNGIVTTGVEAIHYFLTGGYVFTLNGNDNLKIKPAFMAKGVEGAPLSIDLTTNVLINNKFEAGLGYRLDDSVSGLASFYVTPTLRIGYSYDYTLTNLRKFNTGSHEVFVLFDLDLGRLSGKGYDKSPRFF